MAYKNAGGPIRVWISYNECKVIVIDQGTRSPEVVAYIVISLIAD